MLASVFYITVGARAVEASLAFSLTALCVCV
jgi:hypothetical protein